MEGKPISATALVNQANEVFPNDLNPSGALFGGRALQIADTLAAIVAKRHTGCVCVTLGIDSVRFINPARQGDILLFNVAINRTWRTSLEIGVHMVAEDFRTGKQKDVFSAYFTFVAIDAQGKPIPVPPALPETEIERQRHEQAEARRQARLKST